MERTGRLSTPRAQRVRRSRGARAIVILTILMLTGALTRLQVLQGAKLAMDAKTARMRPLPIPAPRGTIYDRTGQIVAENIPAYRIMIMPDEKSVNKKVVSDSMMAQIERLRPVLGLTDAQIKDATRKWRRASNYPMILLADAPVDAVARLEERRSQFPGAIITEYAKRNYPAGSAIAHMIGYVNEISDNELASKRFAGYEQGTLIGKDGLERQYEELLGGTPGKKYLEVDASGHIRNWVSDTLGLPPIPGRDLQLYLDLDLQKYVETIFPKEYNGAFVAIDPQTGGVLAFYSNPSFDPNQFIGGVSTEYYASLNPPLNPDKPQLNRVSGSTQPPASTWKLMMGAIALDLGVITPEETMPAACTGGWTFGRYARCWGVHGKQDLVGGILNSCDVYFYQVGVRIGLKRFMEVGTKMGFQNPTGIDLPSEKAPIFPTGIEWYPKHFKNDYRPNENEIMSLSIGQSVITMTPIKMAQMYVALARPDGVAFEPRLAKLDEPPKVSFKLNVTDENLNYLRMGMRRVVSPGGTAQLSRLEHWDFLGKTGTAQMCQNCPASSDHAWFAGMAGPKGQHPEIVAVMFLEHGQHGYLPSGYIADAVNFYLDRKHGRPFNFYPTPRKAGPAGVPTGDWVWAPLEDYDMHGDIDTYPTIDKIKAYWESRGKKIEGLEDNTAGIAKGRNPRTDSDSVKISQ